MSKESLTDWQRIDALRDEEIDYSDIPDMSEDEEFWAKARLVMPVTIFLEKDLMDWFKSQDEGFHLKINEVLRAFKESHSN